MKWSILFFAVFLSTSFGCDEQNRERALQLRESELQQKEQELFTREKAIQVKEEEHLNREKLLDSVPNGNVADTLTALHPNVPGLYNVTMRCTETTCPGSAVGDTKNEQWAVSFENNAVLIKAMSDKKLVRIYKGNYVGNSIELTAQQNNMTTPQAGNMIVRLQQTKENGLEGIREITRPENCRTTYDLDLKKQ